MSGLLRNLAAQALSLPPAMRPAARLRSAATSGQDEVIQEHEPIIASKPAAIERPRVEDVQERTPNALPPSSTIQSTTFDREAPQTQRVSDHALATSLATREVTDHGDRLKAAPVAAIAESSEALVITDAPAKTENPRGASREIDADHISKVRPNPIPPAREHLRSREAPARFDVLARVRERIVEEHAAADVHIHINRVELTALTAPAPSVRASASRPNKPMSLDQYLQQRKRKTP